MLSDLAWLPAPPDDFRQRAAALKAEAAAPGKGFDLRLIQLATHRLDDGQLGRLAGIAALVAGEMLPSLSPVKLGLLGDGSLTFLPKAIAGSALRHGLKVDVVEGGYNGAVHETADPDSALHRAGLDMALLALDYRLAGLDNAAESAEQAAATVEAALARVRMIVAALRSGVSGALLIQTLPAPVEPLFGSFDLVEPGSVFAMITAFNRRLADWAATGEVVLVDIARLAASIGHERWDDPRHWHASKIPFSPDMIPVYADVVARALAAIRGKAKKALVLDLDNTLWGGVIGDDGLDGIVIGQGSGTGEAFVAIQKLALALKQRGVVLAVCSKNEEDAARLPFRNHPDMLLREEDIAVFQANWTDKAANLRVIAETLNIGVDALVFLDDNPAERAQVRQALPLVGVPELPDDPAYYPRMLAAAGYFEAVTFSAEDRGRADFYRDNALRAAELSASGDMDAYLASLQMVCTIRPFDAVSRARTAQLVNKSNQFNLTTRRYSEAEIAAFEADPAIHAINVRLTDRFGDNGLIAVIIVRKALDAWEIDSWLMSCRVLGRRVQEAVLASLVTAARASGVPALVGRYSPSAKNRMVRDHYLGLGFACIEENADGVTVWQLDALSYKVPDLPMQVVDDQDSHGGAQA